MSFLIGSRNNNIPTESTIVTTTITSGLTQICYSPKNAVAGTVSLVNKSNVDKRKITTQLETIPSNAIIDSIEFFGVGGFTTKGTFSIGLGQLNDVIKSPLIVDSNMAIANERAGGFRQFTSTDQTGKNNKNIVLYPNYINASFEHPVTAGSLQVVVYFHVKPTN